MKKYSRVQAYIDLSAVEYNFEQMYQNLQEGTRMLGVIKADGYGHGALPIAKLMEPKTYMWGFATATAEEALLLRKGGITKPIMLLGPAFEEHYEELIKQDVRICVFTMDMAKAVATAAKAAGKDAMIHFALDTGMSRIGYPTTADSVGEMLEISHMSGIQVEGLFTHFARADEKDVTPAKVQLNRYLEFVQQLEKAGLSIPVKHCSNSAGLIRLKEANLDMVRAGISIYGMYPSDEVETEPVDLKPVMSLVSHITYVKTIEPGTQVSYGGTFEATQPTRVATIPVGYADGYPRMLSGKGYVLIHGKKAPILGRVCMDQFMVDVTAIPEAKSLDQVVLVGADQDQQIYVEELSALCGRFNYEFVCDITKRVPRTYIYKGEITEQIDYF